MTKDEIKKGLECCLNNNCCVGCPYDRNYYGTGCKNRLYSETIDLIDYLYNLIGYGDKYAKQFKDKICELEKENEKIRTGNSELVFIDKPFYSKERECWCVYQKSGDIVQTLFMTEEQAKTYKERKDLYYRGIEKKVVEEQ